MTSETTTFYAVNQTGLDEIREYLERFSQPEATNEVVRAYATDAEQSLNESEGMNSSMEIRGSHSTSGNPIPFDLSADGWDAREEPI